MDFDQLKNQVSNLSLYDIKAGFRKAQNGMPDRVLSLNRQTTYKAHPYHSCHELHRDGVQG